MQALSLVHLMRPPLDAAGDGKPPLLVLLHGYGSNEADLFGLAPYLDERFLIVSARGPIELSPGAYAWFHITFGGVGFGVDQDEARQSCRTIIQFIDEAVRAYDADPQRVFLAGFSQGASMSLSVLMAAPEKVAGVAAMSGFLLPANEDEPALGARLAGKPVLLVHGDDDDIVPVLLGRRARDTLSTLPVDLTYREYAMRHQVTDESLDDVSQWLSQLID